MTELDKNSVDMEIYSRDINTLANSGFHIVISKDINGGIDITKEACDYILSNEYMEGMMNANSMDRCAVNII